MTNEGFSYRWGVPILDQGDTRIPNGFFDVYSSIGVSRSEFLMILHLARYQFESQNSECRPSIATIAKQLGYSTRAVQGLLKELETRGFLKRHYRSGQTTIYDFSGFSQAAMAALQSKGGEPQFMGGVNHSSSPGVNHSSPKEEKTRTTDKKKHDDSDSFPKQDPATDDSYVKVPANGNGSQPAPPPEDALAADERGFLDELAAQSEERNAGVLPRGSLHWADRAKDRPWLAWHSSKVRARSGVSAEALQKIGWLIERETGLAPVDGQWSGWEKALVLVYKVAVGDMSIVEVGVKAAWAKEDKWKPSHAQGFVKEVQKARALKVKRESERKPVVGTVYQ